MGAGTHRCGMVSRPPPPRPSSPDAPASEPSPAPVHHHLDGPSSSIMRNWRLRPRGGQGLTNPGSQNEWL